MRRLRLVFIISFMLVGVASFSYAEMSSLNVNNFVKEAVILAAKTLKIPGVDDTTEMKINTLADTQKKIIENNQSVLHQYIASDVTFNHKEWGKFAVAMYVHVKSDGDDKSFDSEYTFAMIDKKVGVDDYKEALKKFVGKANLQGKEAANNGTQ